MARAKRKRDIGGRVVAITGAARGIGLAAAEAIARAGGRVALGDLSGDLAAESAEHVGGGAVGLPLDVSDRDSFRAFLDAAEERLGPVDALVNNAGVMFVGPFEAEDDAAMRRMIDVNLIGTILGMRLAIERMRARGRGGHIVNVVSAGAWVAAPHESTYSGTKHGVKGVCEGLRPELRGSGIELSLVYPGLVRTELAAGTKAGRGGAWIEPREVGDAIAACLESPRPEVFVPRNLAFLLRLYVALPVPGRLAMGRLFGVDRIATEADHAAREAYERRVATG